MKKDNTLRVTVFIVIVILLLFLVILYFNYASQNSPDVNVNTGAIPESVQTYFVNAIWEKGVENLGGAMPVEGFNPELYKGAFPGMVNSDFQNTEAIGGEWVLQNGELSYIKDNSDITSADGTLTEEGIKTLLKNVAKRSNLEIQTNADADSLLNSLSEKREYCTPASRTADACIEIYSPVCGYFDESVRCIKAPCAATYSNSCFACMDEKVSYWVQEQCPV
jgi:hypothetical protein